MIDSGKRDIRTRGEIEWDFVISSGKRCFSVNNKVEEIRISCECVGGLNLGGNPQQKLAHCPMSSLLSCGVGLYGR